MSVISSVLIRMRTLTLFPQAVSIKEALINWLHERIASLRGTHSLAYQIDMSRLLRSVRLALHHVRWINQRFPKFVTGFWLGELTLWKVFLHPLGKEPRVFTDYGTKINDLIDAYAS